MPKEEIIKYPLKKPLAVNQLLVDLYNCQADLNDETKLLSLVTEAAKKAGAHVLQASVHRFSPMGCSVVVILKETHISIHTWPEFDFAALDIFLCGESRSERCWRRAIHQRGQPRCSELPLPGEQRPRRWRWLPSRQWKPASLRQLPLRRQYRRRYRWGAAQQHFGIGEFGELHVTCEPG